TTLYKILVENPKIIVEISSHTDSKGDDEYNMKLSQRRAESVVNYLIKKGIEKERLHAKGYGETKPIAPNVNPDGSDNPEGRAKNRRTEFKIIGILPTKYSDVLYEE
ncbi:MAG: OmpA family protein, partial [Bacteroidetes bacterium]